MSSVASRFADCTDARENLCPERRDGGGCPRWASKETSLPFDVRPLTTHSVMFWSPSSLSEPVVPERVRHDGATLSCSVQAGPS